MLSWTFLYKCRVIFKNTGCLRGEINWKCTLLLWKWGSEVNKQLTCGFLHSPWSASELCCSCVRKPRGASEDVYFTGDPFSTVFSPVFMTWEVAEKKVSTGQSELFLLFSFHLWKKCQEKIFFPICVKLSKEKNVLKKIEGCSNERWWDTNFPWKFQLSPI